jgi:hypothetical protein
MGIRRSLLILVLLACAAPRAAAADGAQGQILVRGWCLPAGSVLGYNLYMSEHPSSDAAALIKQYDVSPALLSRIGFRKMNGSPIVGAGYLIRGLKPYRRYFFALSSIVQGAPPRESRLSPIFHMLSKVPN